MPSRTPSDPPENFRFATEQEMQWWRDARFGLFLHWGPAALSGGDISWSRKGPPRISDHQTVPPPQTPAEVYDNLYKQFNPTLYNPREWVAIARSAGMKYMVLTAKHHDGFCLWDTAVSSHRVTAPDCPCGRDLVGELADACHEAGMRLGIYYSARDWYHPDYLTERHDRYLAFYHAQLLELLCKYGKVDVLWFDHIGGEHSQWDADLVFRMARTLQPGILINNRLHATVYKGVLPGFEGDFNTPECHIGDFEPNRAWESCTVLVEGGWSFVPDGKMMSLAQCIAWLVRCAGGDGNCLLNTGPMPDGRIEPRQADRLREVGEWLGRFGHTIYGTRGGPFRPGAWGACTYKGHNAYLHVLAWPESGPLKLPPISSRLARSEVLTGGSVAVEQTPTGLNVSVPPEHRDPINTLIALKFDRKLRLDDVEPS